MLASEPLSWYEKISWSSLYTKKCIVLGCKGPHKHQHPTYRGFGIPLGQLRQIQLTESWALEPKSRILMFMWSFGASVDDLRVTMGTPSWVTPRVSVQFKNTRTQVGMFLPYSYYASGVPYFGVLMFVPFNPQPENADVVLCGEIRQDLDGTRLSSVDDECLNPHRM